MSENNNNDLVSEANLDAGANAGPKAQHMSKLPIIIIVCILASILFICMYGIGNSAQDDTRKNQTETPKESEDDFKSYVNQEMFSDVNGSGTVQEKVTKDESSDRLKIDDQNYGIAGEQNGSSHTSGKTDPETQKRFDELEKKYNELLLKSQQQSLKQQGLGNQAALDEQRALGELKKELANQRKIRFLNGLNNSSKTSYQALSNGSGDANINRSKAQAIIQDPKASVESKRAAAEFLRRDAASRLASVNNQNTGTSVQSFDGGLPSRGGAMGDYGGDSPRRGRGLNSTLDAYNGMNRNNSWDLGNSLEKPANEFIVRAGFVIPATLVSGINSDLPGQVIAQVNQAVYDTATGEHLLIPQGTRLIGQYQSGVMYGQERVMISWQRLVYPDNRTIDIGSMPGTDTSGFSGFADKVNNHWWKLISSAFLMSGITASISIATDDSDDNNSNNNNSTSNTVNQNMKDALAEQMGNVIAKVIERNLNIAPTIEVRPGYNFNVMVTKDLTFEKPYEMFDYKE